MAKQICPECKRPFAEDKQDSQTIQIPPDVQQITEQVLYERTIHKESYENIGNYLKTLTVCDQHCGQSLEYICEDHDVLVCSVCVTEKHSTCSSVKDIGMADMTGYSIPNLDLEILDTLRYTETMVKQLKQSLSVFIQQKNRIQDQISQIRREIKVYFDKKEQGLLIDLSNKFEKLQIKFNKAIQSLGDGYGKIALLRDGIIAPKINLQQKERFRCFKIAENENVRLNAFVESVKRMNLTTAQLEFRPSDAAKYLKTFKSFGSLDVVSSQNRRRLDSNTLQIKPLTLFHSFETSKLKENLRVFRACFLPGNKLLFCAFNELCLFLCNKDGSGVKTIALRHQPLAVALYDRNKVIVSLGIGIQILDADSLILSHEIQTDDPIRAVCVLDDTIWVRSNAFTLSKIDTKGNILETIQTIFDPRDFFMNDVGDIFCSSNKGNKVYMVNSMGTEQAEFYSHENLKLPKGVAVDNGGNVYVSGYQSYNIHRISPDGEGEVVLGTKDNIHQPRGLSFDREKNELLVVLEDGRLVNIYTVN